MYKHILIPTDGSPLSDVAIKQGLQLAKTVNAKVTVITTVPPFHVLAVEPTIVSDTREQYDKDVVSIAERRLAFPREAARVAGVVYEDVHMVAEHPWAAIVEMAKTRGCDGGTVLHDPCRLRFWCVDHSARVGRVQHPAVGQPAARTVVPVPVPRPQRDGGVQRGSVGRRARGRGTLHRVHATRRDLVREAVLTTEGAPDVERGSLNDDVLLHVSGARHRARSPVARAVLVGGA